MSTRVTIDDFFSGLLAGLCLRDRTTVSIRGETFDAAVARTFEALTHIAEERDLSVKFRIRQHPLHGDSAVVRDAISRAAQRDLISLDNPEYQDIRLKLRHTDADGVLRSLPLDRSVCLMLAGEFIDSYETATS